MNLDPKYLEILACPKTKAKLVLSGDLLVSTDPETRLAYRIEDGIPNLLVEDAEALSPEDWKKAVEGSAS